MCKPQPILVEKSGFKVPKAIRLSPLLLLQISVLSIISFVTGCFVKVIHSPWLRAGISELSSQAEDECVIDDATIGIGPHKTSGQHLIIELNTQDELNESNLSNVMQTFAQAMEDLSHHPLAYSNHCDHTKCLAVSFGGHITIHSIQHTLIVDLFLHDHNYTSQHQQRLIQSLLNTTSTLFYGPIKWSHRLRGFRNASSYVRHSNPLDHELGVDVLRRIDDKHLLVSTRTKYQNVDIYELPRRRFNGVVSFSQTLDTELLGNDRALYLDGVLQSSLYGDSAYHEALVHPGMLVYSNPQRIAIIGGGEGATLREVLKHNTVEHVVMLEIDEELTTVSREHLKEWSDCGDIAFNGSGSSSSSALHDSVSCFDDGRVELLFVDAFQWFIEHFSWNTTAMGDSIPSSQTEVFDVIIMDALDPDDFVEFADQLYNNTAFIESLYNGLSPEGVFVVQLGASPDNTDPSDEFGAFRNRANMITRLQDLGFESIHIYEESHCDFYHPWAILVALKDYDSRSNWYRNAAEIQIQLCQRIHKTKSGDPSLLHFDEATMLGYQVPSKSFESIYCRQDDEPEICDDYYGFWPGIKNIPISEVMVQKSSVSEQAGRGIFAVSDIPEESMIDLEQGTKAFYVAPSAWDIFDTLYVWAEDESDRTGIENHMAGMKYFIEG
jgi:spermidine synthase